MGEVVQLDARRAPEFTMHAKYDYVDERWAVTVDYYDKGIGSAQSFREVADALVPIAGGLFIAAEGVDPSTRGPLVANVALYEDGNVTMHCPFDLTEAMRDFIIVGLRRAKDKLISTPLKARVYT